MKASKCTGYMRENKAISPLQRHLIFILHPPRARAVQGVRSGGTPRAEKRGKSWGKKCIHYPRHGACAQTKAKGKKTPKTTPAARLRTLHLMKNEKRAEKPGKSQWLVALGSLIN